ncbi:MAG: Arm DNA-binding domain-containing protein [Pseudolabrys sp.]
MAKGFTDIAIKNLKAGDVRREIPDSGCAGLYLVLHPSGARAWAVRYRHVEFAGLGLNIIATFEHRKNRVE